MKKIILLISATILLLSTTALAATVTATGEGPSKEQALSTAMRRAVEQGVGTFINSSTTVIDSALVDDKILSHSKGYVKTYKIVRETRSGEDYLITITATVDRDLLKGDFDALTILRNSSTVGNPKILVVFRTKEKYLTGKPFVDEIYNGIVESLSDKQFRVVDREAAQSFSDQLAETHDINLNVNKAAAYGLKYQAEYTFYYNVSGSVTEGGTTRNARLLISSQLIDNTRAEVIANKRIEQNGSASTVEKALDQAGREGGKSIVNPVKSGGGITTFEARYKGKRDLLDRDVLRVANALGWVMKKISAEGARSTWKKI